MEQPVYPQGEGERVLALESREGTRASRRVEEGLFGGRRKAVRDRLALQGGTGDFP